MRNGRSRAGRSPARPRADATRAGRATQAGNARPDLWVRLELGQQSAQLIGRQSADVGVVVAVLGVVAAGAIVLSVAALSEERKERR